jgi:HAD superfamily hydrolase (TIGR01549 family)
MDYGMDKEQASYCTASYLKAFRKCPENPSMSLNQWRSELWRNALPEQYRHLAYEIYEQWLKYRYQYLQLPNELVQMLRQLRKNYLLVIITNGPSNAQWEKIHKLGLSMGKNSLFDCILVSSDCDWEKPDPRIFFAACNYLGVSPHNCIMVGDKLETDIKVKSFITNFTG